MTNTVANPIENQANEAGKLFAVSELDAAKSLDIYARAIGEDPDYATWVANRTDWVNGYTEAKPQAKGNSADQAFARFARRLTDTYGINAPKAQTEAALKKAAEREAKAEIKRESRGVEKPANFDAIEEAKQDAKDAADRKKISDMGYAKGGMTASKRADGCCIKGKTRGKMV